MIFYDEAILRIKEAEELLFKARDLLRKCNHKSDGTENFLYDKRLELKERIYKCKRCGEYYK